MFKNVPNVQDKIRLHVKYLLNVNSLEVIWSSFLLLLLIKNAIKKLLLLYQFIYGDPKKILKSKILKSWHIQVKLVFDGNYSFQFSSYKQCHHKVSQSVSISVITFLNLSDINTTLKIGITITWSFTMRYVITAISLWCWKKISYNNVTSISMCNRSINIACPLFFFFF